MRAAARYCPTRHNGAPFDAYARRVIRGAIVDSVRRANYLEATRPGLEDAPEPAAAPDLEDSLDRASRLRTVQAAVAQLPARLALIIHLHYSEELDIVELAPVLRLSRTRASQLHCEAVRRLREHLA